MNMRLLLLLRAPAARPRMFSGAGGALLILLPVLLTIPAVLGQGVSLEVMSSSSAMGVSGWNVMGGTTSSLAAGGTSQFLMTSSSYNSGGAATDTQVMSGISPSSTSNYTFALRQPDPGFGGLAWQDPACGAADGYLLCAGGRHLPTNLNSDQILLYNSNVPGGTWAAPGTYSMSVGRRWFAVVGTGKSIYMSGGWGGNGEDWDVNDVFNTTSAAVQTVTPLAYTPLNPGACACDGFVVVAGGSKDLTSVYDNVNAFNAVTHTRFVWPALTAAVQRPNGACVGGFAIFVGGGAPNVGPAFSANIDIFNFGPNPANPTMTRQTLAAGGRRFIGTASFGNFAIFAGGYAAGNTPTDSVLVFERTGATTLVQRSELQLPAAVGEPACAGDGVDTAICVGGKTSWASYGSRTSTVTRFTATQPSTTTTTTTTTSTTSTTSGGTTTSTTSTTMTTTSSGSSSSTSTGITGVTSSSSAALSSAVTTAGPAPRVSDDQSSGDVPFPWWIIAAAAGGCCCCLVFVIAAVVFARRRRTADRALSLEPAEQLFSYEPLPEREDEDMNPVYDSAVFLSDAAAPHLSVEEEYQSVAELQDGNYARIPDKTAVEGTYLKLPQFQKAANASQQGMGSGDAVEQLDIDLLLVDTSRRVGSGTFGDVYRGRYGDTDVAIKVLKDLFTDDQLASFFEEAVTMASIPQHPCIVGFLGAVPDPFMLVSEFCGQGSLLRYLLSPRTGALTQPQQVKICRDIADGMALLAQHKIIHRDLAARNCLLDNQLQVKICDFGMSRQVSEAAEEHTSKSHMGPVRWMAVESIKQGTFSEKSDVWSFAVTAWETLHGGATPYGKRQPVMDVVRDVIAGRRLEFVDTCPDHLYDLFQECMKTKPSDRPTFKEIVSRIDEGGADEEVIYAQLSTFEGIGVVQSSTGDTGYGAMPTPAKMT